MENGSWGSNEAAEILMVEECDERKILPSKSSFSASSMTVSKLESGSISAKRIV